MTHPADRTTHVLHQKVQDKRARVENVPTGMVYSVCTSALNLGIVDSNGFKHRAQAKKTWRDIRKASRLGKEVDLKRLTDDLIY